MYVFHIFLKKHKLEKASSLFSQEKKMQMKTRGRLWGTTLQCLQSLCTTYITSSNSGWSDSCPFCFFSVVVNQESITLEIDSFFKHGEGWRYDF